MLEFHALERWFLYKITMESYVNIKPVHTKGKTKRIEEESNQNARHCEQQITRFQPMKRYLS